MRKVQFTCLANTPDEGFIEERNLELLKISSIEAARQIQELAAQSAQQLLSTLNITIVEEHQTAVM